MTDNGIQGMDVAPKMKAPGCFGAASVYSLDGEICRKCSVYNECGADAHATLARIRGTINVSDIITRHEKARELTRAQAAANAPKPEAVASTAQPAPITAPVDRKTTVQRVYFEVSADQQEAIARIGPKKTKELAISLCKMNKVRAIHSDVLAGVNPFAESGPSFMRVACALLVKGAFTKASLKTELMDELGWTDGTAAAHVSQAIGFLEAFGVIVGDKSGYIVKPASC